MHQHITLCGAFRRPGRSLPADAAATAATATGRPRWAMAAVDGCWRRLCYDPDRPRAPRKALSHRRVASRKWTFERDKLIVRDHKGEPLAEMSFAAGRFQGNGAGGGSVALARP